MSNELTRRMQGATAEMTMTGTPVELRRSAETHRRTRRAVGGVGALAIAVAVIVGTTQLNGQRTGEPSPANAPAVSTSSTQFRTDLTPTHSPSAYYTLMVVRDRNVVFVLETSGYSDRPMRTMEFVEEQAIPSQTGRCGTDILPCPEYAVPAPFLEIDLLEIGSDPLMSSEDWRFITGQTLVAAGPPIALIDCVTVSAIQAPRTVAATYTEGPNPGPSVNQFVMQFASAEAAGGAVAALKDQFRQCVNGDLVDEPNSVSDLNYTSDELATFWPVDEAIIVSTPFAS